MPLDSFFARRSRRLMRHAVVRPRFCVSQLEDRVVPAITGSVFQDYNANGARDTGGTLANDGSGTVVGTTDIGIGGVTVTAIPASGPAVTTTTAADGTYSLATTPGVRYRIEFGGLPAGFVSGPHGANSGTTVQFATDGAAGANNIGLGLVRDSEYFGRNPLLLTSEYQAGDQGLNPNWEGGTFIVDAAIRPETPGIVGFRYSSGSSDQQDRNAVGTPDLPAEAPVAIRQDNVGSTWGLGLNRRFQQAYAAAFTKRHAGWGPGNPAAADTQVAGAGAPGAIYRFDIPDANDPRVTTAEPWFSLPVGDVLSGAYANFRSGYTSQADYETDGGNLGWDAVGKTSLGGLDVNDAGTQVYVMNLSNRRLYVINVNADGSAGSSSSFAVPTPAGVPADDMRPFAVQFYRGLVYVGLVNSAESTQQASDLRAYVYTFDPATNTYSAGSVLNEGATPGVSLNYSRRTDDPFASTNMFMPWTDTVSGTVTAAQVVKYPQPMLTGIAFDGAGNMSLGIRDRTGDSIGRYLPSDPANPGLLLEGFGLGDLLKAYQNTPGSVAGGWSLEANAGNPNNPQLPPVAGQNQVGQGPGNNQGPGGGEFYAQDGFSTIGGFGNTNGDTDGNHRDVNLGGIAQLAGFPDVLTTAFDPQRGDIAQDQPGQPPSVEFRSAGVRWFNSTTGLLQKSFKVYDADEGGVPQAGVPNGGAGGTFGKANGLGDLIGAPSEPPPVEIGNRVFRDLNENGIQDANEPVLAGVTVELRSVGGSLLFATATTDADGLYYFQSGAELKTVGNTTFTPALRQGDRYQVRIPNALGNGQQTPLRGLQLTAANVGGGANVGRDSAGRPGNGTAAPGSAAVTTIDLTGTARGQSIHVADFGFIDAPRLALGDFVWVDVNNNGVFDSGFESGLAGVPVSLFTVDAGGTLSANPVATQTTKANGGYLFTELAPGKYVVQITPGPGYRSSSGSGLNVTGPFEPVTGNPLVNNQDHGSAVGGSLTTGFVIRANPVTLFDPDNPGAGTNPSTFTVGGETVQGNAFQDFGVYKAYSLGNRVWLDKNNSGTIDAADGAAPGLAGVTVRLYSPASFNANGTLAAGAVALRTATTDANGFYRFDNLLGAHTQAVPGNANLGKYVVVVDPASAALAGLRSSTGAIGLTGPFEPPANAIPAPSAAANRLDSRDTGTTAGGVVRGPVYTLGPGANTPFGEADLAGSGQGAPDKQADMTADFGFFRALRLGDLVFNDKGNDGRFTPGVDVGIDGVTVQLFRSDVAGNPIGSAIASRTTANGGAYLFDGLTAGDYVVRVDGRTLPAGFWRSSSGTNGSLSGPFEPTTSPTTDGVNNTDRGTTVQQDANTFLVTSQRIPLAADNLTIDYGFYQPVSLGNFVFTDPNNDGRFVPGPGEAGLANVPVRLYADTNGNGTLEVGTDKLIAAQTTDAQGFYLFTDLAAGNYFVEITPPAGFIASTPVTNDLTVAAGDNRNHGTLAGTVVRSGLVTVAPGAFTPGFPATPGRPDTATDGNKSYAVDFGVLQTLALGDTVFSDVNNNGVFDRNTEVGIGGVRVDLMDPTGTTVLQTTTTAANGTYLFTGLLPGRYQVRITPPAGFISSTGRNGGLTGPFEPGVVGNRNDQDHGTQKGAVVFLEQPVTLLPGGQNPNNGGFANLNQDFGLFTPLSVGDFVWEDKNNNGKFDPGETPLGNFLVQLLDGTGNVVASQRTTDAGLYRFVNLSPGQYQVRVTTGDVYRSSTGTNGNLVSGPYEPGVNGIQNNEDHGTQGVGVATGGRFTLGLPGSAANPNLNGTANLRQDFGLFRPLTVGDFVWNDANNNGLFDAGESPLAGVPVSLFDAAGNQIGATINTAANGGYRFTGLVPGTYTVRVVPPAGFISSTGTGPLGSQTAGPFEPGKSGFENNQDHGTKGTGFVSTAPFVLGQFGDTAANPNLNGAGNLRQDFGLYVPGVPPVVTVGVGQIVFRDENNNGIQDAGDVGIPGVPVALLGANGQVLATTTTGADGKYLFVGLAPATYTVRIDPPDGLRASTPVFGPLEAADKNTGTANGGFIFSGSGAVTVGNGPAVGGNTDTNFYPTFNFGLTPPPVPPVIAQVSGFTYLDVNRNDVYDQPNGDRPIPNVTVTLTGNGITRTTISDGTGFYQFTDLPPGSYTITETQPGGLLYQAADNVGTLSGTNPNENVLTVTLAGGDNGMMYNFGEVLPGFVNGYVWVDANRNCVFDVNEVVVGNVPVTISGTAFPGTPRERPLQASDLPGGSLTVLTDAGGFYSFPVLPPGTYSLSRGALPPNEAIRFLDGCLQNGDPSGTPPTFGPNQFAGVDVQPDGRGPFNFGLVVTGTGGDEDNRDNDPSKDDFLGSTPDTVPPTVPLPPNGGPSRGPVSMVPSFTTTTGTPATPALVSTATGPGTAPQVRVFDYAAGFERFRLTPYEDTFTGGVRTATGDVDGDGTADILTVTGPGGGPRVRAFSGTDGSQIRDFFAFESSFRGGAFVTAGDINGDGNAEIIVGAEQGGGPRVIVFDGATGAELSSFFAFDPDQRGGVRVAAGDFDGDGRADIVTTTGAGVPTRVRTFSGSELAAGRQTTLADFVPYEDTFTGGVNLAVGDYNGDGSLDIVVGAEAGGGPRVQAFDGRTQATLVSFFAFESTATGGVRVAAQDVDGDGRDDLVVTPGTGGAARVRVLRAGDLQPLDDFFAFTPEFTGGAFVG